MNIAELTRDESFPARGWITAQPPLFSLLILILILILIRFRKGD